VARTLSQRGQTGAMANETQIEAWSNQMGPAWVAGQQRMDRQLDPVGRLAIDALLPRAGERILDIGCGTGSTSLQLVDAVGTQGAVVGVDVSAPMLALARQRAASRPNVTFIESDVQTHAFSPASFDGVFSRFGVMFFDDPVVAFANVLGAMRPGGRLAFVCWQSADRNQWMSDSVRLVADLIPPPPPMPPDAPGPFAFGDANRVRSILDRAGWHDIAIDAREIAMVASRSVEEAVAGVQQVGPLAPALASADPSTRSAVLARVEANARERMTPEGLVMQGAVSVVRARRAG